MNIWVSTEIFKAQSVGGISRLWRSLLPELQKAMPDATFSQQLPPDVVIPTYYAAAPLGTKSLVLCYDAIGMKYPLIDSNRADIVDMRRAIAEAAAVVSISQGVADDVKRLLGRDSTVAHCGIDVDYGKVMPSEVAMFQQFVGKPYVLVVGNRGLYKNVQTLYQAWRLWEGRHTHKLLVIGGEQSLPQDEAFAAAVGDAWMHMTLDDHDLQLAYAGATALCYPSLMEGFGLPIVEAMACACPVICDHAMREVGGLAPYYVDVTRPRQIAAALTATLDMSVRMTQVMHGIAQSKRYTWAGMAAKVAEAIRRIA